MISESLTDSYSDTKGIVVDLVYFLFKNMGVECLKIVIRGDEVDESKSVSELSPDAIIFVPFGANFGVNADADVSAGDFASLLESMYLF